MKKSMRKMQQVRLYMTAAAFLLPYMVFYALFMLYPILKGGYISLFKYSLGTDPVFVGLKNYAETFADADFWLSLWHTVFFVLISTPSLVIIGLLFALLINAKIPGQGFFRAAYFIPYTLSISVITNLWVLLLQPHSGFLNVLTQAIGIGNIPWLNSPRLAWVSVLIATLWWTVGFNMILLLAGLREVPQQLYEAAKMDGAGSWQSFRHITLPSLKGVLGMVSLLQVIASFKLFGQTYLMLGGGPGNSTRTLVQYIYEAGFQKRQMGLASAYSVLLLVLMLLVSMVQNKAASSKQTH